MQKEPLKTTPNGDLGRAIARGIVEAQAQKERNMAKAGKRKQTMLENAARDVFNKNY